METGAAPLTPPSANDPSVAEIGAAKQLSTSSVTKNRKDSKKLGKIEADGEIKRTPTAGSKSSAGKRKRSITRVAKVSIFRNSQIMHLSTGLQSDSSLHVRFADSEAARDEMVSQKASRNSLRKTSPGRVADEDIAPSVPGLQGLGNLPAIRERISGTAVKLRSALLKQAPHVLELRRAIREEREISGGSFGVHSSGETALDIPPIRDWGAISKMVDDLYDTYVARLKMIVHPGADIVP